MLPQVIINLSLAWLFARHMSVRCPYLLGQTANPLHDSTVVVGKDRFRACGRQKIVSQAFPSAKGDSIPTLGCGTVPLERDCPLSPPTATQQLASFGKPPLTAYNL
jgi:hypothetical protein